MSIRERWAFLWEFRAGAREIGAVQPSSRFLARAMTRPLRRRAPGRPDDGFVIVEMGPGTGAVTRHIVAAMDPRDRLDCYEINPAFADRLEARVDSEPEYAPLRGRIRILRRSAERLEPGTRADFVICSVPFNNLPAELVDQILREGRDALRRHGTLTYFEYAWLPMIRRWFVSADERRRVDAVRRVKQRYRGDAATDDLVLLNLPPARVVHVPAAAMPDGPGRSTDR